VSGERGAHVGPVMLFSPRRREVERFYREIVGLTGDARDDSTWLDATNAQVVVHDPTDRQTPEEVRSQIGVVVWFGVLDVRAAYERARHEGLVLGDFQGDFFFARDPDGRFVGIYTLEDHHGHDHEH